jgi:hypothetical protein
MSTGRIEISSRNQRYVSFPWGGPQAMFGVFQSAVAQSKFLSLDLKCVWKPYGLKLAKNGRQSESGNFPGCLFAELILGYGALVSDAN